MSEFDNGLTPAETERLELLAEECGEVIQAAMKVLRHGYDSVNPMIPNSRTNREHLMKELGDVLAIVHMMCHEGEISTERIDDYRIFKLGGIGQWLHHQKDQS